MALRLPATSSSSSPLLSRGWLVPLALLVSLAGALPILAQEQDAASKGAQIYCFMRNSGNSHLVSWDAAYAVIKRQTVQLFKTSPQHAAVMITEAVVNNPAQFPDCGRYLGDLFRQPETSGSSQTGGAGQATTPAGGTSRNDRYGY